MNTLFLVLTFFVTNLVYSQTEYDYYEKQRLERKEKKVKEISSYYLLEGGERNLIQNEFFNKDGKLERIEMFAGNDNIPCKFKEIIISGYSGKGDLSGMEINYNCGEFFNQFEFNNYKPSFFYNLGFGEDLTEEVLYFFDNDNKLIEQVWVCPDCGYSPTDNEQEVINNIYGTVKFVYENDLLIKNIYENKGETKYFYNIDGLLEKKQTVWDWEGYNEENATYYEYKFYK